MATKDKAGTIAIVLSPEIISYLDGLALEKDLNRSQVVRMIIREYQNKKKRS